MSFCVPITLPIIRTFLALITFDLNGRGMSITTATACADSIWVDLGMPVQTAPDGRQYKPLFADPLHRYGRQAESQRSRQLNDWNNDAAETGTTRNTNPSQQLTTLNRPAVPGTARRSRIGRHRWRRADRAGFCRSGLGYGPQEVSLSPTLDDLGRPIPSCWTIPSSAS